MKVLFIPDMSRGNPYQRLYADALSRIGVETVFGSVGRVFPILRAMRRHGGVDVVHLHWTHVFIGHRNVPVILFRISLLLLEILLIRAGGVRVVWTVHNRWNHEERHIRLDLLASRLLARLVDSIIVGCPAAADEIRHLYRVGRRAIEIVPLGNYADVVGVTPSRAQSREALGLAAEDRVFLFFGLIRPYKGVFELIEAFRTLQEPDVRLCIVGRPLNAQVAGNLELGAGSDPRIRTHLDFVPDDILGTWLAASDVVVIPFQNVLTTSSVLHAMSAARAVIAPRIGCVGDVLDEMGAILYDPREEDGLRGALRAAVGRDLDAMGSHNLSRAMREFDWDAIAEQTLTLYGDGRPGSTEGLSGGAPDSTDGGGLHSPSHTR